jgi:hypothetical protein
MPTETLGQLLVKARKKAGKKKNIQGEEEEEKEKEEEEHGEPGNEDLLPNGRIFSLFILHFGVRLGQNIQRLLRTDGTHGFEIGPVLEIVFELARIVVFLNADALHLVFGDGFHQLAKINGLSKRGAGVEEM